jgi:hypothetical protein
VFPIGTAAATTLEFDLSGGAIAPPAITIDNANQTLKIGPSGSLVIQATQNVANGTILMAGGHPLGHQRHIVRHQNFEWIAEWLRNGFWNAEHVGARLLRNLVTINLQTRILAFFA